MSNVTRAMPRDAAREIARAFLPKGLFGSRYPYHYARIKLASDPLYPGVCDALRGSTAPLLDIGCGMGLLAHALRRDGQTLRYRGVDADHTKIERARMAATRAQLMDASFEHVDLERGQPAHTGSVTILDVLQFIDPSAQSATLDAAVAMLVPGARLVIRTGLDDGSGRARITRGVDVFSRVIGWMRSGPERYPAREALQQRFDDAGLRSRFAPLRGNTPFNNWLVVAER